MRYKTTREDESAFQTQAVEILRTKLGMTKKMAEREMSWFILQWGLTTTDSDLSLKEEAEKVLKSKSGE